MSFRKADRAAYLQFAPWAAFLVSVLAALIHTQFAYLYFRPSPKGIFEILAWPGPGFVLEWAKHAARCAAFAVFAASLPGTGNLLRRRFFPAVGADLFVHIGLGLIAWATLALAWAACGLSAWARIGSAIFAAVGFSGLWSRERRRESFSSTVIFVPVRAIERWLNAGIGFFAAFLFLTTIVPDVFYDALVYHLAVPFAWLREGKLVDLPNVHHSRLPGLVQGLYYWGLAWSDDRLCKILNWGIGILAAWSLAAWTSRQRDRETGLWAGLFYLSSPMIGVNVLSCTNDILCGFLFFLSFTLWVEAWQKQGAETVSLLTLSGIFFGGAVAAKYTAIFAAPFFVVDFFLKVRGRFHPRPHPPPSRGREEEKKWTFPSFARRGFRGGPTEFQSVYGSIFRLGAAFAIGVLIPLLPWWIRTAAYAGNPFYPELASLFGGDSPEAIALLSSWKDEARGAHGFFSRLLSLPRECLRGVEEGRFGFVGPVLLMLLPLALFSPIDGVVRALGLCSFLAYGFYAVETGRLRYFIPQIGILFALASIFLADYTATVSEPRNANPAPRRFSILSRARPARWLKTLVAVVVALNGFWLVLVFARFNQGWDVVLGRKTETEYLKEEHIGVYGHPSQGAFDFLKTNALSGKLFIIGEARNYRSPIQANASGSFNVPAYALWLKENPSPETFIRRLQAEGYRYLLLNAPEWRRLTPATYKEDAYARPLAAALDLLSPPVYRDNWTVLFRIPLANTKLE